MAMTPILAVFGERVTYRPAGGDTAPRIIVGVLDEPHQSVEPGTRAPVSTTAPTLTVRIADLPQPPVAGDALTADGRDWLVNDVQPDGGGNAKLKLHRDHGR